MEQDQQPTIPPTTTPVPEAPVHTDPGSVQTGQKSSLTIFLAVALILVSILAGFLGWQNQQLVKNLREQLPTTTLSPTPTATSDPTVDWKLYINRESQFSLKYPTIYAIKKPSSSIVHICPSGLTEDNNQGCIEINPDFSISIDSFISYSKLSKILETPRTVIIGQYQPTTFVMESWAGPNSYQKKYYVFTNGLNKKSIMFSHLVTQQKETFDQILSTFRFTE